MAPYEHVRLIAQSIDEATQVSPDASRLSRRYEPWQSGSLRALKVISPGREEVYLAHPDHSFEAERKTVGEPWEIRELLRWTRGAESREVVLRLE